tara:strand:+ start:397 stop:876 length:480 start_codon:yes stop_codon:yes gene_type:complete
MSEEEKEEYQLMAKHDKERFEKEKQDIIEKSQQEVKKMNIFLIRSHSRVSCVGLDNGFTYYEVLGPAISVVPFTDKEKQHIYKKWGVALEKIPKYKTITVDTYPYKYNHRAAKKWGVTVYGGTTNNSDTWWGVRENYEGKTGKYIQYVNYKGETWTENY